MSAGKPKRRRDGEATRSAILTAALTLFREEGFDKATMRAIAASAGVSPGAAYHYFPSKQAIAMAFYEEHHERYHLAAAGILEREPELGPRLAALWHENLRILAGDRRLLGTLARTILDPNDPLSAFSEETRHLVRSALEILEATLAGSRVPEDIRPAVALALWCLQLALLLYMVHDDSPEQARSHRLVDDAAATVAAVLALASTPLAQPFRQRLLETLDRAGLLGLLQER